eukprot:594359-Pelagomonas_calceolata.AAC.4
MQLPCPLKCPANQASLQINTCGSSIPINACSCPVPASPANAGIPGNQAPLQSGSCKSIASLPMRAAALWEQALQALGQHQQLQQKQQQPQPSEDLQRLQELLVRTLAASARGPVCDSVIEDFGGVARVVTASA